MCTKYRTQKVHFRGNNLNGFYLYFLATKKGILFILLRCQRLLPKRKRKRKEEEEDC